MGIVYIDGREVEVGDDERLNGIQAARRAGIEIPHYCWHPGLSVVASCRMCLVETGTRDAQSGEVRMMPKLVPACQTPAKDGTVFVTASDKVAHARALVEECLLIDHPIDCPICDKAGECLLQDYHFKYGQDQRRADLHPFTSRRRSLGDTVTLFVDRCVMCSRCVRFTREITGTAELMVVHRGEHEEIDVFPGYPLANKLSGNVVDLCPVGALGAKDFLYKQRVWYLDEQAGVCPRCSTGCSIWIDQNHDEVYRLRPRENPHVNQWWMCDEGRWGYHHANSPQRWRMPQRRGADGRHEPLDWMRVGDELSGRMRSAGRIAVVLSPWLTVEEAYMLARLARQWNPDAWLGLGPVPVVGQDERFPSGFVIHAEKCPNRRGIEAVLTHFGAPNGNWQDLQSQLSAGRVDAAWVSGGYPDPWIDEAQAEAFGRVKLLVVQDLFDSPLAQRAEYLLPGASFAEREGSYVNYQDRLQSFSWAVRPPAGVLPEGRLYWRMLQGGGLYRWRQVLDEVAATIPFFAAAGGGEMPPTGVDLRVNLLASAT